MWTTKKCARYERKGLRYESDLTDEEYALIEPFLPPERNVSRRSLVNGILYVLTTGSIRNLGVTLHMVVASTPEELDIAFASARGYRITSDSADSRKFRTGS
jgi:hypothetical protein